MRILVVNWLDRENPSAGGAEVHLHETFGRLAARGHSVTLLTSGWPGAPARVELDGMRVHRAGGRHTFSIAGPRYLKARLSHEPFDVVVEDLNKVPLFMPLWTDAPVVLLVHHLFGITAFREAVPPIAAMTWLLERPVPFAFRRTPTIAVSESTAEDLVRRGFSPERIRVIPNGVDVEHFTPLAEAGSGEAGSGEAGNVAAGRAMSGTGREAEPSLLYLGRLKRYKRIDLIIRAVGKMRDRGIRCRLRLVGKGDHRRELETLVTRLRLQDRVDFPGFITEDKKLDLLRRSWIHVITSPREGWGIVNLEAAACGTPTVASDSPGLRDSVRHEETGILVPHGDVDRLAAQLTRLILDPEELERMGRRARAFAEGFSWEETATRVERVLEASIGRRATIADRPVDR